MKIEVIDKHKDIWLRYQEARRLREERERFDAEWEEEVEKKVQKITGTNSRGVK